MINKNIEFNQINNNKIDNLNHKINNIIENKLNDNKSITEINDSIKEINNDLINIISKIDDSLKNSIIDLNIKDLITYINSLNYFQSLAFSHLFIIILISILLIEIFF